MSQKHTVEENEVGTPKDYAHQIISAFKQLEHGVSYFNGIPCMEAGEEDMMYDLIINALHHSHQEELEKVRRATLTKAKEMIKNKKREIDYIPTAQGYEVDERDFGYNQGLSDAQASLDELLPDNQQNV